ncbi:MAG: molybdopterin-dependent oxidoreductase [Desulfarculus sp.]|nr:molybdopterin-dependent oxidoreductase [Pseudomonadota bacterium]MBU4576050.1 molybdopterin-dependent oxidoreductase [Pseudomonadota bacterium]MBU4596950.1 molybdopterin-dependent oxidoreductase [Pseudomonadota bacterium]MBV1714299.1 molybdopterin-dependent oxidoreductase [Desulfarculus sp.]MBV1737645.1 molybdopterin-dependent oxidoreductase [Desulfarculus sp.]
MPRLAGASSVFGGTFYAQPTEETGLILLWGSNPLGLMGGERRERIQTALKAGAKMVVVDPKAIRPSRKADIWISPRPQSDGVLALGFIKVLIEEKLYDQDFVTNWTVGFDELAKEVATFTLDDVERLTWVPKEQIVKAARMFAHPDNRPFCLWEGNGLERNIHAYQNMRAINIMAALLGDVNKPGGNVKMSPAPFARMGRFYMLRNSPRRFDRGLCSPFRVGMPAAYVPPQAFVRAVLEDKPYPIKAAISILTNPLISYPDTEATYKVFQKLDFVVTAEIFPSPTTAMSDIVLPAAWGNEHSSAGYWPGWQQSLRAYPQLVEPPGEAKSNPEWINELAKKTGLGEYFWEDWHDCLEEILKPSGLTYEQFKEKRCLKATKEYERPEQGLFKTPSGKAELYSEYLKQLDYEPTPRFAEVSQFRYETSEEYPLLMFNGKEEAFMNNGYKHVQIARALKPYATVQMNPATAEELGLVEDEWVYIETPKGRIQQVLKLDPNLHPKLVFPSMGWWYPEDPEDLFQFRKSNINVLTSSEPPYDCETGSVELGAIPCRVYPVKRD